jgi:phage gp46-like protein
MDIALQYDESLGGFDIYLDGSDLAVDDGLETAAILSLFLDRFANADDPLPKGASRRGWWGDRVTPLARPKRGTGSNPDRIGSRLWLLQRECQLPSVLPRAKAIIAEALAWMTEDGWASSLDISVSFPRRGWFAFRVKAYKPDGTSTTFYHQIPWGL